MKTSDFFLLFLLCTLAGLVCRTVLFVCRHVQATASYGKAQMGKNGHRICRAHSLMKRKEVGNNKSAIREEVPQKEFSPAAENGVVGSSRTVFITQLPVLKSHREIKPFKSEPLKITPQDNDDEKKDPGRYDTDTAPVGENELDDFELNSGDEWPGSSSSGVSFEELSETSAILAVQKPSRVC